jgi:hypothetical protein
MEVSAVLLQPIPERPDARQANVVRAVIVVEHIDTALIAEVTDSKVRPPFAQPAEHPKALTGSRAARPTDLLGAPEQAVGVNEAPALNPIAR